MPTCATSIWESTLLAASLPRFRFFISSKLISWLVNSDCIFCWKTKTAVSKVWGNIVWYLNYLDQLILNHVEQQFQSVEPCQQHKGGAPAPLLSPVSSSGLLRARETWSSWSSSSRGGQGMVRTECWISFFL